MTTSADDKWIYEVPYKEEDAMKLREKAKIITDNFNRIAPIGTEVTYFKSDIEGRQKSNVKKAAYIQGDSTPVVILDGIGIALIEKVDVV